MKYCSNCGNQINEGEGFCSKCGTKVGAVQTSQPVNKKKGGLPAWAIVLIVLGVIFFLLVGCVAGCTASLNKTLEDNKSASEGNVSNGDNNNTTTASTTFTYQVDKQYNGDYGIGYYIEGKVKNNADKDFSYVQIEFICYDKQGNNLGTAIANTNNLLGGQTWKYKAMFMESDSKNVAKCEYHEITSW